MPEQDSRAESDRADAAHAEPEKAVRRALKDALADVDSQAKADEVVDELEAVAGQQTAEDVRQEHAAPITVEQAGAQVARADAAAPAGETAKAVLAETARAVVTADGPAREALSESVSDVLNPELRGVPEVGRATAREQRTYLQRAVLKRLKLYDALDVEVFLAINHLPHNRWLNGFFRVVTTAFTGGAAWYAVMAALALQDPQVSRRLIREAALPLTIAGTLVEFPIKSYFRRKRPFIDIIQAIVVGRKPGTWSFPSGHAAVAFAGALLLSMYLPQRTGLLYTIAGLVGFSRVYLGAHYPGDVAVGSLSGMVFAMAARWLLRKAAGPPP